MRRHRRRLAANPSAYSYHSPERRPRTGLLGHTPPRKAAAARGDIPFGFAQAAAQPAAPHAGAGHARGHGRDRGMQIGTTATPSTSSTPWTCSTPPRSSTTTARATRARGGEAKRAGYKKVIFLRSDFCKVASPNNLNNCYIRKGNNCWESGQQAAAYYFHRLILDERETEEFRKMAIAALQASEEFIN